MSKMSDAAGKKVNDAFDNLIRKAKEARDSVEDIDESTEQLSNTVDKAGKKAKKATESVSLKTVKKEITEIKDLIDKIFNGDKKGGLSGISKQINDIAKNMSNLNDALGITTDKLGKLRNQGIAKVMSELNQAITSYRNVGGNINKVNKKSHNFFTDILLGTYEQRQQIIRAAIGDAKKEIANANPYRESAKIAKGFNADKADANSIGRWLKKNDPTAFGQWDKLDTKLKAIISDFVQLGKVSVLTAHKQGELATDVASGLSAAYPSAKIVTPAMRRAYIKKNYPAADYNELADVYNSEKRVARNLERKDSFALGDNTAAAEMTRALTSIADSLKNNTNTYKVEVTNQGADQLYSNVGRLLENVSKSGDNAYTRRTQDNMHNLGVDFMNFIRNKKDDIYQELNFDKDGNIVPGKKYKNGKNGERIYVEDVKNTFKDAVSDGVSEGIKDGLAKAKTDTSSLKQFSDAVLGGDMFSNISAERRKYGEAALRMATGIADPNEVAKQQAKIEEVKVKEEQKTVRKRADIEAKLDRLKKDNAEEYMNLLQSMSAKEKSEAELAAYQYQQALEKAKQADEEKRAQRERWFKDEKRFRDMLAQYDGKEKTELDKKIIYLQELQEEYEREYRQAMNNKGNEDAHLRTLRKIQDTQREINGLIYKQNSGYQKSIEHLKKISKLTQVLQQVFQRTSAFVGSVTSIASTIRSQAQNLFGYLRNGIRQLTGQLRNQLTSAISAGTEQFDKLEKAKIGFESFYGGQANQVLKTVRAEALKTPIVTAGDLADYVSQLAPVSGGDANLAINAALGALKAIQYSGNDTSEMEYVVKNIRDVIAKGKATAIDVRQFNRALPAMTKALEAMGESEFLKDGELKITPQNAKSILKMFADLNTNPNSPVRNISERMLNTTAGMKQLFQEIRTNAFETIYTESGLADLVKQFYKMASNTEVWDKFTTSISKFISNVLDKLKAIDWKSLGKRLSEGMTQIIATLKGAAKTVFESLGVDTNGKSITDLVNGFLQNRGVWQQFWDIIKEFINGFAAGMKDLVGTIKFILKNVDADFLKKAASVLGYMLSPMGKIWLVLGSIVRDALAGVGRLFGMINSGSGILGGFMQKRMNAKATKFQNIVGSAGINPSDPAMSGYNMYGSAVFNRTKGTTFYMNGQANTFRNSAGQFSNWKGLTFGDKVKNVGLGNTVKATLQPVVSKIGSIVGKLGNAAAIYTIGSGVANLAGTFINTIAPEAKIFGQKLGDTTSKLGEYGSAVAAGAVTFGPLGALAGGLVQAFKDLATETDKLRKAEEEARKQAQEANRSQLKNDLLFNVMENLRKSGDYKPYEEYSEDAYEEMAKYFDSINDNELAQNPAKYMEEAVNVYYKRIGKSKVGMGLMDWKNQDLTGTTGITSSDLGTYKNIVNNLVKAGLLTIDEDTMKELGNNVESWQGWLKANGGWDFGSQETLNNFNQTLNNLTKEYDKWAHKELKIDLLVEEDGTYKKYADLNDETFKKWMEDVNGFSFIDGKWQADWYINLYYKDGKTGKSLPSTNPLTTQSTIMNTSPLAGGLARGGFIRPIYRAAGGGARGVDVVPAMLQPGEFVMRRSSVAKVGNNVLAALNRGDLKYAYRALGGKVANSWNNSRNWSNTVNNNQRSSRNQINIYNRNASQTASSYVSLANRIALA